MSDITYKLATASDLDTLAEYRLRFAIAYSGNQPEALIGELRKQLRDYFEQSIRDGSSISILAISGTTVAGIGSMMIRQQPGNFVNPSGRWGYIMNMYTVPDFRRQGICTGILNELTNEARRRGIHAFELHATPEGEQVYVRNEFEIYPEPTYRKFFRE